MFYNQTKVVVEQQIIKHAIKEVRYIVKKHKDSEKRKNKRIAKMEKKDKKDKKQKKQLIDKETQTEEYIPDMIQ